MELSLNLLLVLPADVIKTINDAVLVLMLRVVGVNLTLTFTAEGSASKFTSDAGCQLDYQQLAAGTDATVAGVEGLYSTRKYSILIQVVQLRDYNLN